MMLIRPEIVGFVRRVRRILGPLRLVVRSTKICAIGSTGVIGFIGSVVGAREADRVGKSPFPSEVEGHGLLLELPEALGWCHLGLYKTIALGAWLKCKKPS